jgi:hypothetical protein
MKPYRYLDCDNLSQIQDKIYSYLLSLPRYDPKRTGWQHLPDTEILVAVPELKDFLDKLNLTVKRFHVLHHIESSNLHTDYSGENEELSSRLRMNFPIKNTHGTAVTEFYELVDLVKTVSYGGPFRKTPYYLLSYTDKKLVGSYELTKPVIIDTWFPHIVQIDGYLDQVRVMLTIDFTVNPFHLLNE